MEAWHWVAVGAGLIIAGLIVRAVMVKRQRNQRKPTPDDIYPLF